MIRRCFIFCFFIFTNSLFSQEVIVKNVEGSVVFLIDGEKRIVENFDTFSNLNGAFRLYNQDSNLFLRVGDDLYYKSCDKDSCDYPVKKIVASENNIDSPDNFLTKFLKLYSLKDYDNKIDGMLISDKSSVSRNVNANINTINFEEINIIRDYPFKIDFSNIFNDSQVENVQYECLISDKISNKQIFSSTFFDSFFEFSNKNLSDALFLYWDVLISSNNSDKKISFSIKEKYIDSNVKKMLDELKYKAIQESKTKKIQHQIIFIESLLSMDLVSNASYFLDFFIEQNTHAKLLSYRNNHLLTH